MFVKSPTISYVCGCIAGMTFILVYNSSGWLFATAVAVINIVIFELYKWHYNVEPDFIVQKNSDNITTEELIDEVQHALKDTIEKADEKNKDDKKYL